MHSLTHDEASMQARVERDTDRLMTAISPRTRTSANSVTVAIGRITTTKNGQAVHLWATPDMDDYAYEAVYNPTRISLTDAEASVRTQLAEYGVQVAAFLNEDGPLPAWQRGPEWMLRWNCPIWCVNDHTESGAPEWHHTAKAETVLRDAAMDASGYSDNGHNLPWLAARVVVINDKPQAYGRKTEVWVDYGIQSAELTPARAREVLAELREFAARLEGVIEAADREAAGDFEGDPEIAAADREGMDRWIRAVTEASA
jgi:uncharacterized protein DUF6907